MAADSSSYIDYETFVSPAFSAASYANKLVLATNNANDTPIDLSTPLSRVLFDQQEVDTHIDTLTTSSAQPLIQYTRERSEGSRRILDEVEGQVEVLKQAYERLEKEILTRYEAAEEVQRVSERLVKAVRLVRAVGRALQLGRSFQGQVEEVTGGSSGVGNLQKQGDHRGMVPAATTLLALRQLFASTGQGEEGEGLGRVNVITTLRQSIIAPGERQLLSRAQQVVREFSMSSLLASSGQTNGSAGGATYARTEDTRARTAAALHTLYLLSPTKPTSTTGTFEPILLITALSTYLQTALTSSTAALARALATLPTLDRTLLEISARCQNIVALEALLFSTKAPTHPLLNITDEAQKSSAGNFLEPLLKHLDTSGLPSYFWRSMAGQLTSKVQEILGKGGVSARTLRTNRDRVREAIRDCVDRGSQLPSTAAGVVGKKETKVGNWEREAAVMVGSVIGPLQRG